MYISSIFNLLHNVKQIILSFLFRRSLNKSVLFSDEWYLFFAAIYRIFPWHTYMNELTRLGYFTLVLLLASIRGYVTTYYVIFYYFVFGDPSYLSFTEGIGGKSIVLMPIAFHQLIGFSHLSLYCKSSVQKLL